MNRRTKSDPPKKRKVIILGGGPNRIGQGIEFDYCCVQASFALEEMGIESIMVNSNPETVSTDYDTSDKLYFEPLTREDVLNIIEQEKPEGVIVQFGGRHRQPLRAAGGGGGEILGTSPDSIDRAEDRKRFQQLLNKLDSVSRKTGLPLTKEEAIAAAARIGYPVVVRPSFVLGGRAMEIVYDQKRPGKLHPSCAVEVSPGKPVLIDRFLGGAIEIDVDALSDGRRDDRGRDYGAHRGSRDPQRRQRLHPAPDLPEAEVLERIKEQTKALAGELGVVGLMNIQYAVKDDLIYVLEVNPRASRTVPFVSKATGIPLAKWPPKSCWGRRSGAGPDRGGISPTSP
jgi:carbamoyl-phosphate synthase large subunit